MSEEISWEEIFSIIKQKLKLIIVWTMIGVIGSGILTFFVITPKFESSTRIVVNQTQNTNQSITNTDIQTNLNLINTYQSIIKEPIILEDVIKKTGTDLSLQGLSDKITVHIQNNSLVFGISVLDETPYVAADLANAIGTTFEQKIGEILDVQSVTILSEAVPNLQPVSPNTLMNLSIGFLIGLLIGLILAFISSFSDKRVKDTKIIDDLGWINLGSVLEMTTGEIKETRIDKKVRTQNSSSSFSRRRV